MDRIAQAQNKRQERVAREEESRHTSKNKRSSRNSRTNGRSNRHRSSSRNRDDEYKHSDSEDNYNLLRHNYNDVSSSRKMELLRGICNGMVMLHSKKILHLDLKPENVLISGNGTPWVADFGLDQQKT